MMKRPYKKNRPTLLYYHLLPIYYVWYHNDNPFTKTYEELKIDLFQHLICKIKFVV